MLEYFQWTIISKSNPDSKKPLTTFDEIYLKSTFGKILRNYLEEMKADHSFPGPECILKVHRADILPLSEWNYLRPIQSKFDICPLFKYIFEQDNKFFKYSNFQGSKAIKICVDEKSEKENFISNIWIY